MKRNLIALAAMGLFTFGCAESPTSTQMELADATPAFAAGGNGVIHHVSVGGNDFCDALGLAPGCDANFSLTATMKADGSVKGQWNDTFAGGGNGVHISADCLNVQGNWAVIGGVITKGKVGAQDVSGQYALTAAVDNGTSSNDAPDQISFSIFPADQFFPGLSCTDLTAYDFPLLDMTRGQVTVK